MDFMASFASGYVQFTALVQLKDLDCSSKIMPYVGISLSLREAAKDRAGLQMQFPAAYLHSLK